MIDVFFCHVFNFYDFFLALLFLSTIRLLAVGDEDGSLKLYNYPCISKDVSTTVPSFSLSKETSVCVGNHFFYFFCDRNSYLVRAKS